MQFYCDYPLEKYCEVRAINHYQHTDCGEYNYIDVITRSQFLPHIFQNCLHNVTPLIRDEQMEETRKTASLLCNSKISQSYLDKCGEEPEHFALLPTGKEPSGKANLNICLDSKKSVKFKNWDEKELKLKLIYKHLFDDLLTIITKFINTLINRHVFKLNNKFSSSNCTILLSTNVINTMA